MLMMSVSTNSIMKFSSRYFKFLILVDENLVLTIKVEILILACFLKCCILSQGLHNNLIVGKRKRY